LGHKIHIIDSEKAPFIQKMFELYSSGNYTVKSLMEVMYKEGLRNRVGKQVGKSRMYDLLTDPFYCGFLRWKSETHKGMQEPLISKELFDTVQKKLNRVGKTLQVKKHLPVFKAKMKCGECSGTITWEIQKGHWYGHCNHYKDCGQKIWWRQEKVEEKLFPLFDNIAPRNERILGILEKALKETHADEIDYHAAAFNQLTRELDISQKRLEALYDDKIDQKISGEFYEKKFKEYTSTKESSLEALQKLNDGNTKYYQAGFAIHELASRASEIYLSENTHVEDKRLLLSKIFSNLELEADNIRPNYTLAFEFLRDWMPKINSTFEPIENGSTEPFSEENIYSHPILLRE
jgi:site-specific DNA recombinase